MKRGEKKVEEPGYSERNAEASKRKKERKKAFMEKESERK